MKRFGASVLLLLLVVTASAQSRVKSSLVWDIDRVSASVSGDSVDVVMTVILIDDSVERGSYVSLKPVLKWIDREYALTPLSVCSPDMKTGPESGMATMTGRPGRKMDIRSRVPYDISMNNFSISVSLSEFRGGKEYRGERRQVAVFSRKPRPELDLKTYLVEPARLQSEERTAVIPLRLKYSSDEDYELDLDDAGNFAAFDAFLASCSRIVLDERTKVSSMTMSSYTALSGTESVNRRIASARLKEVITCLTRQKVFGKRKIVTGSVGEDWTGVQEWFGRSFWSDDQKLRGILFGQEPQDRRESRLKEEYPEAWEGMRSTLFPDMERMECVIRYSVIDLPELKDVLDAYRTEPGFLEPRDFYRLLAAFEPYSYGWNEVLIRCAETWPRSEHSNHNAAAMLLDMGRIHEAGIYLRRCGDTDDARYLRAVQMAELGNVAAAQEMVKNLPDSRQEFRTARQSVEERFRWDESPVPWDVQVYRMGQIL